MSMINRAKADLLRAKELYSGLKWDWSNRPNWRRSRKQIFLSVSRLLHLQ